MSSLSRRWIAIGSLIGAIGVTLGAFGAHVLPVYLSDLGYTGDDLERRLDIFHTAILYQLLHALALVFTGLALEQRAIASWRFAAWAFLLGVILFSGSLKALTFVGPSWNWLGMVAPIGGISMIVGWAALAIGALRKD
ncbi:MAG TPA: DUF423 domain-containing protein [Lacipirellulaceae bacterium]|nr:DUF423 domain-containing protein [Lacipirellulaceae bacterium]